MNWKHKLVTLLRHGPDITRGEVRFDRETRTFWMWDGQRWLTAQQAASGAAIAPYTPLPRSLTSEARAALRRVTQRTCAAMARTTGKAATKWAEAKPADR